MWIGPIAFNEPHTNMCGQWEMRSGTPGPGCKSLLNELVIRYLTQQARHHATLTECRTNALSRTANSTAQAFAASTYSTPHVLSNTIVWFRGRHTADLKIFSLRRIRNGSIKDPMSDICSMCLDLTDWKRLSHYREQLKTNSERNSEGWMRAKSSCGRLAA